ncbi:hypothetical protein L348_06273 [Enterobacter sp. MGH 2]|nr:hypothetical protein L354_02402 [Enterobacter sp. MGH 8]EUM36465.1 hypothetical protein L407_01832 [Enterobacter sp. BWH 39]EUM68060.1 hypothetical protein L357_01875 [Enterobacter sp. MGH 11]EUN07276.1 hypothetical protein L348_06273 [Enterobacter sp. MGH 2]CAE7086287.1 hypothetical protein AI2688V1_2422 [Enterobacter cloacae]SAB08471.1 Uncharacterised protein [Enterobacter hormaechei]
MVKTVGNGFVSLNTNTNWRVESIIALSQNGMLKIYFIL